jgi:hypothetical protein
MADKVTIEAKCADCGYPYIDTNFQGSCPRCGKKRKQVSVYIRDILKFRDNLVRRTEYMKINKKILFLVVAIFIVTSILSLLTNQVKFVLIGIALNFIGIILGYFMNQKIVEIHH